MRVDHTWSTPRKEKVRRLLFRFSGDLGIKARKNPPVFCDPNEIK